MLRANRLVLSGAILLTCGCATLNKDTGGVAPAATRDDSGCDEQPPAEQRVSAVMVNRSWLARYPTLQLAVSECFRDSDSGAVLLSLRVSRKGFVCDKTLQRDSTGRPASVSCFLNRFVRWEMNLGAYRLLVDLTARDRA
jgi:hypothetical protein